MSIGSFIRGAFMLAALLATLAQIVIDPTIDNVASACIVLSSSLVILLYMHWSDALRTHPLSTFVIFGFCLTTQLGALLVQTMYWTPLSFSLYDSIYTFGTLAFYQAIALSVHAIYCYFSAPLNSQESWGRGILRKGGLYKTPAAASLWIMGAIGLLGFLLVSRGGVISKLGIGVGFLAWAPFLIPFIGRGAQTGLPESRQLMGFLALYTVVIALLAIAANARGMIFHGVLTVSLLYAMQGLCGTTKLQTRPVLKLSVAALIAGVALQPLGQLVAAMGAARAARGKLPPMEMVVKTYDFLVHPELIRAAPDADPDAPHYRLAYDETYIRGSLLGRFVETKFHDNALHFGRSIVTDDSRERLRHITFDTSLADLPRPLLRVFDSNVDKNSLRFSMGDYLFYLVRGGSLGGFKTGSVFGQGIAVFGPIFPLIYAAICLSIFHWLRLLTYEGSTGVMAMSGVAMMNIFPLVQYGITAESFANLLGSIVRGFPQLILIYLLALLAAKCVLGARYVQTEP